MNNTVIKELAHKAGLEGDDRGHYEYDWFDPDKFAKLIIAEVLDTVEKRAYVSGERPWSNEVDRPWVELHFGFGKLK